MNVGMQASLAVPDQMLRLAVQDPASWRGWHPIYPL